MSLNHLSNTAIGLRDKLRIGCEDFECKSTAQFDGPVDFFGSTSLNGLTAIPTIVKTTFLQGQLNLGPVYNITEVTEVVGGGNVTLTAEQIVNSIIYIAQSTNFVLPTAPEVSAFLSQHFVIRDGMSFTFKVVLRHTGAGVACQIDTNPASPNDRLAGASFTHTQLGPTNGTNNLYVSCVFTGVYVASLNAFYYY